MRMRPLLAVGLAAALAATAPGRAHAQDARLVGRLPEATRVEVLCGQPEQK